MTKSLFKVELTAEEKELYGRLGEAGAEAQLALAQSLLNREAVPRIRLAYLREPEYQTGRTNRSRMEVFNDNGCKTEDAVYRNPHFGKYLHYWISGPELPPEVVQSFIKLVDGFGSFTSGDWEEIRPFVRTCARRQVQAGKQKDFVAEEFYKLALEVDCFDESDARKVRDVVMKMELRP